MVGVLVGLLCALTWAVSSVLMKDLARKLDPFTLNAPRSLIGGLSMFLLTLAMGKTAAYQALTPEKIFFLLASICIGGGIGDTFYIYSLARIGVSQAFPLASTYPALTLLFGMFFLHEEVSLGIVGGLVLVLGGIWLISRPPASRAQDAARVIKGSGVALALVASFCWAVSMSLLGAGMKGLDPIMVASVRAPALSLVLWGIVALRRSAPALAKLSRHEWVILIVGALIGWGLGSVLFLATIALCGPTRAAILTSTSPLFALPLSVLFLKERVSRAILAGTALTVVGIVLVS